MKNIKASLFAFFCFTIISSYSLAQSADATQLLDKILLNPEYKKESAVIEEMRFNKVDDKKILDFLETNYAKPRRQAALQRLKAGEPLPGKTASKDFFPTSTCNDNDIGVEGGSFATWQGQACVWGGCPSAPWATVSLPMAGRIDIVPAPTSDPCASVSGFPIPLPSPSGGNYSIKLGNTKTNGESERITHQFIVQPQDTDFFYQYAVIFDDPGHLPSDSPFFDFIILAQNGDTIPCSFQHYAASNITGFQSSSNPIGCGGLAAVKYKPWSIVGVDLVSYIGQQVTVICTTGDCALCGHFGYAYVDFSCKLTPVLAGCVGVQSTICAPTDSTNSYQWSTGATTQCITVTPTQPDTFSVLVTTPGGCNFSLKYNFSNSFVQAAFTYGQNNNVITFNNLSTGTSTYSWDYGDGSTSTQQGGTHTYTAVGTYTACLVASLAGCSDTTCQVITITGLQGVNEQNIFSSLVFFPNPAAEKLFIDFGSYNSGEAVLVLSDLVGRTLISKNIPASGTQMLDVSGFSNGIYFLKLRTDSGEVTRKVVVSK